jgi:hypothetical protein
VAETTKGALTAEALFERYFAPFYPKDALGNLAAARGTDANPAKNPSILAQIDEGAEVFARLAPEALSVSAADLGLDFSDASVHRLSSKLTRERRDSWLGGVPARGGEPPMIVTFVTHGVLYVGACVVRRSQARGGLGAERGSSARSPQARGDLGAERGSSARSPQARGDLGAERGSSEQSPQTPAAEWQVRRPLWESLVRLTSRAGTGDLAIFQWWLKALSDAEIDQGRLGVRYRAHVEVPTFEADALPVLVSADRKIPRLAKVRYDLLYKHLRAHLPELRSVGDDFPSPERFEEMGFKWLDFVVLGGGRMVLIHGPTDRGVHLFWMDAGGFVKQAYYPADAFPAHVVQVEDDKLRVVVSIQNKPEVHETLWWGA